jgi:hypothetical protein
MENKKIYIKIGENGKWNGSKNGMDKSPPNPTTNHTNHIT